MFSLYLPIGDGMCLYIQIYIIIYSYIYLYMSYQYFCTIRVQGANAEGPNIYPEEAFWTGSTAIIYGDEDCTSK